MVLIVNRTVIPNCAVVTESNSTGMATGDRERSMAQIGGRDECII